MCRIINQQNVSFVNKYFETPFSHSKCFSDVSMTALCLQTVGYTTIILYSYCNEYSLLSYMEYVVLLILEYFLIGLVVMYNRMWTLKTFLAVVAYLAVVVLFAYQFLPKSTLSLLVASSYHPLWAMYIFLTSLILFQLFYTPINIAGKVIQILKVWRESDSTSALTCNLTTWLLLAFINLSEYSCRNQL